MASASQAVANQLGLFEDQEASTQMGFFSFPPNMSFPSSGSCQQSLKPFGNISSSSSLASAETPALTSNFSHETLLSSLPPLKHREDLHHLASAFGGTHLLSLQRSTSNLWAWGDVGESFLSKRNGGDHDHHHHLRISTMKMKKIKGRKKVREPRFCFKTMSDVDVLDDGYKWRKYGQKVVKNTQHPRSYYRCTQDNCRVKKRVERLAEDPRMVITTYEGRHVHSPSHDNLEDTTQPPSSHLNNFFW